MATTNIRFEDALKELEQIVAQMESGELALEQSLNAFKRGTALIQQCQQSLTEVEQQISMLSASNQLEPFADE
jgi:exodeoxyribonuclease VII small subunit